MQLHGFEEVP